MLLTVAKRIEAACHLSPVKHGLAKSAQKLGLRAGGVRTSRPEEVVRLKDTYAFPVEEFIQFHSYDS